MAASYLFDGMMAVTVAPPGMVSAMGDSTDSGPSAAHRYWSASEGKYVSVVSVADLIHR